MDTIKFKLHYGTYGGENGELTIVAEIFVNGQDFWGDAQRFSRGDYEAISARHLYSKLKEIDKDYDYQIFIYDCNCGNEGCDPFGVCIDAGERIVTWYDFMSPAQFHGYDRYDDDDEKPKLPPLVFDKKQYFAEVENIPKDILENKLRLQNIRFFDNNIELIARAFQRQFIFFFDKNLNNPLPQLVQVYNSAQNRDSCEITLTDGAAKGALFLKISAYKTAKGYMYVPIKISKDNQDYFFLEYYEREEFLAMLEKIFSNFFNCEYFSYVAPCLFYDFYSFYNKNSEFVTDKLKKENLYKEFGKLSSDSFTLNNIWNVLKEKS